ncbi:MAG: hypothetical protein EOS11_21235 [Mesorhizobium sp.]|nr:MAG: hypothetical protein EOS10_21960 [Mesorhizobium sp.]RWO39933.1 MAG: hypothetical protein EOS11_21235 [Mesorhizobium sp.]RWO79899.1 MAG: hypothetical protein EOS18_15290 [Mesorhizobium sp.]TIN75476.1 MAG: hypothetical protein E5Y09_27545 [Mesorhizobium sp.]
MPWMVGRFPNYATAWAPCWLKSPSTKSDSRFPAASASSSAVGRALAIARHAVELDPGKCVRSARRNVRSISKEFRARAVATTGGESSRAQTRCSTGRGMTSAFAEITASVTDDNVRKINEVAWRESCSRSQAII